MFDKFQFLRSLILSYKTTRKIVVLESDDWGSERIPNSEVRNNLLRAGVNMEGNPHSRYDTLERIDDLYRIEELLINIFNKYNIKVKLTFNFNTANPDFDLIKQNGFEKYFYKTFDQTYLSRDENSSVLNKILSLIDNGFIVPQYHGREHINVNYWLDALRSGNSFFLHAFDQGTYAIDLVNGNRNRKNLMASLEYENNVHERFVKSSIRDGHDIFYRIFGFSSKTFVAPRYVWDASIENCLSELGFTHIQTSMYQLERKNSTYMKRFHYSGQQSSNKELKYLTRNVYFEPAYGSIDWLNNALEKVNLAFTFHTPAIISMHRINFVGGIRQDIRDKNLMEFKILLETLIRKYPNIEFLSSNELSEIV